jgi:hypothetical protein
VRRIGLPEMLDCALGVLKRARPYQDSDHVLNIAYNLLCGGQVLDDIEIRRNDATFLDALGARAIPDRWNDAGVRFMFGHDASPSYVDRAENLHPGDFEELCRKAHRAFANKRAKQPRVKEEIVRERGYLNLRLVAEDTAEFEHHPQRTKRSYRVVVLRKLIEEERGQLSVGTNFRYFFYITNDHTLSQDQVIAEANGRCDQENIIEQLKNGVRALRAPLNTLEANWAYMVVASLAWSIKTWCALLLPVAPRFREQPTDFVCCAWTFAPSCSVSSSSPRRSCAKAGASSSVCSPGVLSSPSSSACSTLGNASACVMHSGPRSPTANLQPPTLNFPPPKIHNPIPVPTAHAVPYTSVLRSLRLSARLCARAVA